MEKEFVVSFTVTTNVTSTEEGFTGLDAINKAMTYGLGDLIGQGEYNLEGAQVAAIPVVEEGL